MIQEFSLNLNIDIATIEDIATSTSIVAKQEEEGT